MKQPRGGRGGGRGPSRDAPIISDPRFAGMHIDPRFRRAPRNKLKVAVDKRFEKMFTDEDFADPFKVDKRGGPKQKKKGKQNMDRYYKLENEDEMEKAAGSEREEKSGVDEKMQSEDKNEENEEEIQGKKMLELKTSDEEEDKSDESENEEEPSSSKSSDEEDSSSDSSSGEEDEVDDGGKLSEEENVPTTESETRRLAVMNMDWRHISAADLYVLFNSFLPSGGQIDSVTIYPSKFGLEQMKEEDVKGPRVFWDEPVDDQQGDDAGEDGEEFDQEKLREYELSRMKYYFGVVVCDSVATASVLYNSCDSTEFERTSNVIDLRFIPDDMEFEDEPRDTATQLPATYEAPDYTTGALQQTKVKLTWEDDDPGRVMKLRRQFPSELNEDDYKAYLASDDDEEDNEDTKQENIKKLKEVLQGLTDETEAWNKNDVDMEVTFPQGLEELNNKFLEKKTQSEETVWESYLRKKKEKKKEKKQEQKNDEGGSNKSKQDTQNLFDDPFFMSDDDGAAVNSEDEDEPRHVVKPKPLDTEQLQTQRRDRIQAKEEEERRQAELELLVMDDNDPAQGHVKGFNTRKQRLKNKKKQKDLEKQEELHSSEQFEDPRFSELLTSHHFAIDPTHPQFKKSANRLRRLAELQQQRFKNDDVPSEEAGEQKKRKAELSSLVRNLKRKSGNK